MKHPLCTEVTIVKNPHIARLAPETKYRIAQLGRGIYHICMQIYAFAACNVGIYLRKKAARSAAQFSYNVFILFSHFSSASTG